MQDMHDIHDTLDRNLIRLQLLKSRQKRMTAIILALSVVVAGNVFWKMRRTGITMAGDATCGIEEHTHHEGCYEQLLVCEIPEEPHEHDESCYEIIRFEPEEELVLVCDLTDVPHEHSEECYTIEYGEGYDETILICEETDETHIHDEMCWITEHIEGEETEILVCDLLWEPHEHSEDCYETVLHELPEERILICEEPCDVHIHDEGCFEELLICDKEEHIHEILCYADETADVETQLDWQEMFYRYQTGDLPSDLIRVAKSQIGYTESERNFIIDRYGDRHGYTRYGAWYGIPYSDWSAPVPTRMKCRSTQGPIQWLRHGHAVTDLRIRMIIHRNRETLYFLMTIRSALFGRSTDIP